MSPVSTRALGSATIDRGTLPHEKHRDDLEGSEQGPPESCTHRRERCVRPERIRTLLVDDSESFRTALRGALIENPRFEVIGEATHGRTAVAESERLRPDLVVMDLQMPEMDGLQATARIRARAPHVKVLIVTMRDDEQVRADSRAAGADGFASKGEGVESIFAELDRILHGRS